MPQSFMGSASASIDDSKTDTVVQLKRKRTGVVAESVKVLPEKLEFEVHVHPVC